MILEINLNSSPKAWRRQVWKALTVAGLPGGGKLMIHLDSNDPRVAPLKQFGTLKDGLRLQEDQELRKERRKEKDLAANRKDALERDPAYIARMEQQAEEELQRYKDGD